MSGLSSLRDVQARARIRARLVRVQAGKFGDFKPLQDGVQELRIDHGPGYRVYVSRQGLVVVLLLCGSDKSKQSAQIKQAGLIWPIGASEVNRECTRQELRRQPERRPA